MRVIDYPAKNSDSKYLPIYLSREGSFAELIKEIYNDRRVRNDMLYGPELSPQLKALFEKQIKGEKELRTLKRQLETTQKKISSAKKAMIETEKKIEAIESNRNLRRIKKMRNDYELLILDSLRFLTSLEDRRE